MMMMVTVMMVALPSMEAKTSNRQLGRRRGRTAAEEKADESQDLLYTN